MRTLALAAVLPFALLTFACSGDDGPPLGGDVVGSWRALPNATDDDPPEPVADRDVWTFNADGSVSAGVAPDLMTGTYTASGGDLALTSVDDEGTSHVSVFPYRATDDRFVLGALIPAGEVEGVVGTWVGTASSDGEGRTITVVLGADQVATYAIDHDNPEDEDVSLTGTWRTVGDDLELVLMPEPNFTIHMRATHVAGVLGTAHERI